MNISNTMTKLKNFFLYFLPIALFVSVISWNLTNEERSKFRYEILQDKSKIVDVQTQFFNDTLIHYLSDGIIISEMVEDFYDDRSDFDSFIAETAELFTSYMQIHRINDQIRLIDHTGQELIRVDWDEAQGIIRIPEDELQNKADRTYFVRGMEQEQSAYLSSFDLNVENGSVERPYKPMLRLTYPLDFSDGQRFGLIVMNLLGADLIDRSTKISMNSLGSMYLVNERGHWLKGPSPELEWLFMFSDEPASTMALSFPAEWELISSQNSGQFETASGIFTFRTINPLEFPANIRTASPKVYFEESWKIISYVPAALTVPPWWNRAVLGLILGTIGIAVLSFFLAKSHTKRKTAQNELRESEQKLKAIFDHTFQFIGLLSPDGTLINANRSTLDFGGVTLEQARGKKFWEARWWSVSAETVEELKAAVAKAAKGEFIRYETDVIGMQDNIITIDFSIQPVFDAAGRVIYLIPEGRDISERKAVENALKTNELQLKMFVKHTPAAIAMFDREMRYLVASDRWYSDYGIEGRNIIGRSHYDVFPEIDNMDDWKQDHQNCLAGEVIKSDDEPFPRQDGTLDWLKWELWPWSTSEGKIGGIIMFTEVITERKEAERKLFQQAQVMDQVVEAVITTDPDGIITRWNSGARNLLGYSNAEMIGKHIDTIHPEEDHEYLRENTLKRLFQTGSAREEVRMQRKNGEILYAQLILSLERDAQGEVIGMIGTSVDISERIHNEQKIIALNEELEERVRQRTLELEEALGVVGKKESTSKLLKDIASTANTLDSVEKILETTLDLITEFTGWPIGHVYLASESAGDRLVPTDIWCVQDREKFKVFIDTTAKTIFKPGIGLPGRVLQTKKPQWIEDVTRGVNLPRAQQLDDINVRGAFGMPVIAQGEVVAVLEFFTDESSEPDTSILEAAAEVGIQLGYVIERKKIENELKLNEHKFRGIFDQSYQLTALLSTDGKVLQAGKGFLKLIGADESSIVNTFFWEGSWWLLEDIEREKFVSAVTAPGNGETNRYEVVLKNGDGGLHDIDFSFKPIVDNGNALYIIAEGRDITDRKKAENEIRKLALVAEKTSNGVMITNKQGLIEWINDGLTRIVGYTLEEMVGKKPGSILQGPETDKKTVKRVHDALQQEEGIKVEILNYGKNGKEYWVEMDIQPVVDTETGELYKFIAIENDITKRKENEEALMQFKATLDQTYDAVFIYDPDSLRFMYINQGAIDQVGFSRKELLKMTPVDIKPEYSEKAFRELILPLVRGEQKELSFETIHRNRDGTDLPVDILLQYVTHENETSRFIAIVRDITEQKRISRELIQAKNTAEEAAAAKSTFLANMSHEIRTPMNAIHGLSHLLSQTELSNRQEDYVSKIQTSTRALLGIINDILDFSKIEAGQMKIEEIQFDLEDTISGIADMVSEKAQEKGLELIFNIAKDVPDKLIGDPLRLQQILLNLVSNAIKFTPSGEVEVGVIVENIGKHEVGLFFSVRDTGIGLEEQEIKKLFRPFTQADATTTRKYGGTGLGLSICRQLLEMMGGELNVESRQGSGSTFSFRITMAFEIDDGFGRLVPTPDLRNMKVLVVDENATSRKIIQDMLEGFSFKVNCASDGTEALDKMQKMADVDDPYKLVLLNWRLSEMSGLDLSKHILEEKKLSKSKIIIMIPSTSRTGIIKQAERIGVQNYLIKPVNRSILFDTIMDSFGRRSNRKAGKKFRSEPTGTKYQALAQSAVLLVEDNKINQDVARNLLGSVGVQVTVAENGEEAVKIVRERNFDAILMDIQMPVMDGYEATSKIREDEPEDRHVPIIAMTANVLPEDRKRALDSGLDDQVDKPIIPSQLYETLTAWISNGSTLQPDRVEKSISGRPSHNLPSSPVLKAGDAINRLEGNISLYRKLLSGFLEDQRTVPDEIEQAVLKGDNDQAVRLVHTLKGLSGTIGAYKLAETAQELEDAFVSAREMPEKEQSAEEYYEILRSRLSEAMSSISEVLEKLSEEAGQPEQTGEAVDIDHLLEGLTSLEQLLSKDDYAAQKAVDELSGLFAGSTYNSDFLKLKKKVTRYNYALALKKLKPLKEKIQEVR